MSEHAYLKPYEVDKLVDTLTTLSQIWSELEAAMTKQTRYLDGQRVKRTNEPPLPFNQAAAEHLRYSLVSLSGICETVATARNLNHPTYGNPQSLIVWLQINALQLAAMEDAPVFMDAITQVTWRAINLADRPRIDRVAGVCPACGAISRFNRDDDTHTCPGCGITAQVDAFLTELEAVVQAAYIDRKEASDYLKSRNIKRRTRNRWLSELGEPLEGRTLYQVAELDTKVKNYLLSKTP